MQELKLNEEEVKELFFGFKKNPVLGNLSLAELLELIELSLVIQCNPGEYIIKQGESDTNLFILISGKIMWFNRNGHHAKNNYQESEVFDESEAKATELHERV